MPSITAIPGAILPALPRKSHRLREALARAAASEAAVDLLRDLALCRQPERPLTSSRIPAWAAFAMDALR